MEGTGIGFLAVILSGVFGSHHNIYIYTVKKVTDFPFPSRDVTDQTLSLGPRKTITFFYSVGTVGRVVARIKG